MNKRSILAILMILVVTGTLVYQLKFLNLLKAKKIKLTNRLVRTTPLPPPVNKSAEIKCYSEPGNVIPELQDNDVTPGEGIFFLETACSSTPGDFHLNARQACAVESAAVAHPSNDVFLLFLSPTTVQITDSKNPAIQALLLYSNIHLRHVNFQNYLSDTPMKDLYISLQKSQWPIVHANDILRMATMYKYGGIYLDTDVIVMKEMPQNISYVGAESKTSLANGVMRFGSDAVGKDIASSCANEMASTFKPLNWGYNGPAVLNRIFKRRCANKTIEQLWDTDCDGFRILSPPAFYPFPYWHHKVFFTPGKDIKKEIKNSYLVHYWNKFTVDMAVKETSPFFVYAKQYCPNVFRAMNNSLSNKSIIM